MNKPKLPEPVIIYWLDAETSNEGWASVTDEDGIIDESLLVPSLGYIAGKRGPYLKLAGDYDPATCDGETKDIHYNRIIKIPHDMIHIIKSLTIGKVIFQRGKKK